MLTVFCAVEDKPAASRTVRETVNVPRDVYVCDTLGPEPVVLSPKYQLQLAIPESSVDVDVNEQTLREQLTLNEATGAALTVGGGGDEGELTVPPAPFT